MPENQHNSTTIVSAAPPSGHPVTVSGYGFRASFGIAQFILVTTNDRLDPSTLKLKIFCRVELEYCARTGAFENPWTFYCTCSVMRDTMPYTVGPSEQSHSVIRIITDRCKNISQALLDARVKTKKRLGLSWFDGLRIARRPMLC